MILSATTALVIPDGSGTAVFEIDTTNAIASTAALIVYANAPSSSVVVGTANNPTINLIDGDLWSVRATTTILAILGITGSTPCLQAATDGSVSGTGSACGAGSGGDPFAWTDQGLYVSTSTVVYFNSRLMSTGSPTFTGGFRVQGSLFVATAVAEGVTVTQQSRYQ